jgi:hypothetical protein
MPSWSENIQWIFAFGFFWGGRGEPLCRHSVDCCFVSRSSWYNQVSSVVTSCDRKSFALCQMKKFQKLLRRHAPLKFLICVQVFRDLLREELPHVQIILNDGPNPLMWDAQLLSCWFSWNPAVFQDWSIISWVVTVLGCPGWGALQVEKSLHLNWTTQFLKLACNGACSPNVSFRMTWISFGASLQEKTWWQLVSRCYWNCVCHLTCFLLASVIKKRLAIWHTNSPLFPTLSIPSYDIGK